MWLVVTFTAGVVSDRIGRRNTYIIGWIAFLATVFLLFPLADTGNPWLLFPGVSISYAIGAIIGGAFAPTIAAWLVQSTGTATSVAFYIAGVMVIASVATLRLRDRTGIPLGPDHELEQSSRQFVWQK